MRETALIPVGVMQRCGDLFGKHSCSTHFVNRRVGDSPSGQGTCVKGPNLMTAV